MPEKWHALSNDEVLSGLVTDIAKGLSQAEAEKRLQEVGPNKLAEQEPPSAFILLLEQFNNFIVWVLIAASLISGFFGEWEDAVAIIAIVILNAVLGFIQESRAQKSLAALKKLSAPTTRVLRNGEYSVVPSEQVVPGDIVLLEAGDYIPADVRLVNVSRFATQEASLTGESTSVNKTVEKIDQAELAIADRKNMSFMGTSAVSGKANAVVVETGMKTELGKIAGLLQGTEEETTPLQKRLDEFGHKLVYFTLAIVIIVFFMEIWRGGEFLETFLIAVSLAVAAIPEGLPAVVTIALALGVKRMVKRNALIRKLHSVETLGSTSVICSDKTGTLTQNEMTVRKVYYDGVEIDVSGVGYAPVGTFIFPSPLTGEGQGEGEISSVPPPLNPHPQGEGRLTGGSLDMLLNIGVLCNSAFLKQENNQWKIIGDPTEGALLTLAGKKGIFRDELLKTYQTIAEIPFDTERKMMTGIFKGPKGVMATVKGAPDIIIGRCTHYLDNGEIKPLTPPVAEQILRENETLAFQALRVLGMAFRIFPEVPSNLEPEFIETDLIFAGLAAMIDPPRPEVKLAIEKCKDAGICTVMITGDHKNTAIAIARELGFYNESSEAVTGLELDAMSDDELIRRVQTISVYARVSAENKLRIVKAWKTAGAVVAMTGDGVNDAPAVKESDIGVAMGITGTDVTKDASDMVITDDNFASIVAAVEEGRGIYTNIKKFIYFLLSCNIGEVLTMFIASLFALPVPLFPIQILWINIVTDGLPALALGVDPVSPTIMKDPVRKRDENIFNRLVALRLLWHGLLIAIVTLIAFLYVLKVRGEDISSARTVAFSVLVFSQLFHALDCRSEKESIWELGLFTNKFLLLAVAASIALQIMLHHFDITNRIFKTQPLGTFDMVFSLGIATIPMLVIEGWKVLKRRL
ncbi:MAG: cation-translocating P-type ATPase [Deltaproteobacteria bacterium]|nr:cation-translocating P-type ATPase [Deltaproteobacteria bacterium]